MRVITGTARGRKLIAPEGYDTRPTTDKVKEAIGSALHFDFGGAKVLDLFAGSGQMAIEALSRGARAATLIDSDPKAIACIQQNVKSCGFAEVASVLRTDAVAFLQRCRETFDIALLDQWALREHYVRAMKLAAKYEIRSMSNYILYNFKDSPIDLYRRLLINITRCKSVEHTFTLLRNS